MRISRGLAGMLAGGAVLAVAGCGGGGPTAAPGSSKAAPSAAAPTTVAVRPMARVPAGTKVPLVHKGRLTVCEEPTGLPYIGVANGSDVSGNGKVSGFDVDLLSLVATRLRVAPLFVRTEPQEYLDGTALKNKACDLVPSLIPWSGFRKTFALTKPYGRFRLAILTKKGGPATLAALAGKQVGVIGSGGGDASTDAATYLKQYNAAHGNQIHVMPVNDINQAEYALKEGGIGAVVTDDGRALYEAKKDPSLAAGAELGSGYSEVFGVRKGDKALVTQINAALADAAGNGHYAKAYQDWFGRRPTWLPH